jgi:hypothetical protein
MNNLFLYLQAQTPDDISSLRKATYILTRDSVTGIGSQVSFIVGTQPITDAQFSVYGAVNNKTRIDTYIKVSGVQSGATLEFQVQITKGNTPTT